MCRKLPGRNALTRLDIGLEHQLVPAGQALVMDASTAFIAERQTATKGITLKCAVSSETHAICTQNCAADLAQPLLEPTWTHGSCGRAVVSAVDSYSSFYESALMLMEVLYEAASVPTLQQIFGLLNAHGDAHEVVRKAARGAHIGRDGGVAHVARQRYERGHAAKADGDLEELRLLCYRPASLRAARAERI